MTTERVVETPRGPGRMSIQRARLPGVPLLLSLVMGQTSSTASSNHFGSSEGRRGGCHPVYAETGVSVANWYSV